MGFNEILDLKLIKLVQENPILYDLNHEKYMDFNAREVVWQMIGDQMRRPAQECKVRWINIRDVNRRILRKILNNPGQRIRSYKYQNELSFMRPHYRDVPIQDLDYSDINDDHHLPERSEQDSDSEKPLKALKRENKAKVKKKKKKKKIEEEPASTFDGNAEFDVTDPIDAFLLSIGASLRSFNAYHLNLAKSKIFSVVQEHELQQIVHQESSNDVKVSTSDPMFLH